MLRAYTACVTKFSIGFYGIERYFIEDVVYQRLKEMNDL